jgi:hypothetical protein
MVKNFTAGLSIFIKKYIGLAENRLTFSGLPRANILGVISQNTSINVVMARVEMPTIIKLFPNRKINTDVPITEIATFTKLLLRRIVAMSLSRFATKLKAIFANLTFLSTRCLKRIFETAISALSAPDKKAEIAERINKSKRSAKIILNCIASKYVLLSIRV